MLKARLYEAELQRREAEANSTSAAKTDIGWGNQIRSYVLHPYQMVKDLRTQVEKGNAQVCLMVIDDFLKPALPSVWAVTQTGNPEDRPISYQSDAGLM